VVTAVRAFRFPCTTLCRSGGALSGRVASALVDQVAAQRLALQYTGLLIFRAHPVVGIGPGNFEVGLERYGPQISWLWDYIGSARSEEHTSELQSRENIVCR